MAGGRERGGGRGGRGEGEVGGREKNGERDCVADIPPQRIMMDSGSDRSSTSSGSPQSSPLQHQVQPAPLAYPHASPYANMFHASMLKFQAPVPSRQRNAIPIVNPSTGMRVASPPLASPGRGGSHSLSRRAW